MGSGLRESHSEARAEEEQQTPCREEHLGCSLELSALLATTRPLQNQCMLPLHPVSSAVLARLACATKQTENKKGKVKV